MDDYKKEVDFIIKNYKTTDNFDNLKFKKYSSKIIRCYEKTYNQINIINPNTFNEKISYLKIFDCTDLKTLCSDKIKLHNYCKEKIGFDLCVPIINIYNDISYDDFRNMPDSFVLKCNHGWNFNIIVPEKDNIDINRSIELCRKWKKINFGYESCQLQYCNIQPSIYIEEYLGQNLIDYKISCFHGNPVGITIIFNRKQKNYFDKHFDLNFYPVSGWLYNSIDYNFKKPKELDKLLDYSKILSKPFNYSRIDFYILKNKIYLGEITFTPANGKLKISKDLDNRYGDFLQI